METTTDKYSASIEIEGSTVTLETADDLSVLQACIRCNFEGFRFQTDEGKEQVRQLLADYEAAGSPPLRQIDYVAERIHNMIEMDVFLGGTGRGVRYDHPGTWGIDP